MSRRVAIVALAGMLVAGCSSFAPRGPMSDGQRLYYAKCTSCHAAYEPHEYSTAQWQEAVAEMEADKRIQLTEGDRALILGYLTGERPAVAAPAPTQVAVEAAQPAR